MEEEEAWVFSFVSREEGWVVKGGGGGVEGVGGAE